MARVYVVVDFNLLGDWWQQPNKPSIGPADGANIPVQKYFNSIGSTINQPHIRMGIGAVAVMAFNDIWEIPAGSGRYWKVLTCGSAHEGFPNEYWVSTAAQCDATGAQVYHYP